MLLFGEPRLTAPLLEGRLFGGLAVHRAWRRQASGPPHTTLAPLLTQPRPLYSPPTPRWQLPELHATLFDALVAADVPADAARCFTVDVASASERRAAAAAAAAGSGGGGAGSGGGGGGSEGGASGGLDAADVHALSELRVRFVARWPLPLAISDASLRTHERVFGWLLRLRRARWALETCEGGGGGTGGGGGGGGGALHDGGWQCAHPWRVLRSEVLHLVSSVYSHVTLGVLHPEWRAFVASAPLLSDVDAFRAAHEAFASRVEQRGLLAHRHAPILAAIERILGLALRLRLQLDELPRLSAKAHAASAARWRAELRVGVRFVLDELRRAAGREPAMRAELVDLCRLLDYNGFYSVASGA